MVYGDYYFLKVPDILGLKGERIIKANENNRSTASVEQRLVLYFIKYIILFLDNYLDNNGV